MVIDVVVVPSNSPCRRRCLVRAQSFPVVVVDVWGAAKEAAITTDPSSSVATMAMSYPKCPPWDCGIVKGLMVMACNAPTVVGSVSPSVD